MKATAFRSTSPAILLAGLTALAALPPAMGNTETLLVTAESASFSFGTGADLGETVEGVSNSFTLDLTGGFASRRDAGDFDFSGCTDLNDFLHLLDYWGQIDPISNTIMGVQDFLALLDNWHTGADC